MFADSTARLNPTEGHILAGVQIDEHRFLARVKSPQLFQIAPDPRDTEDKRKLAASKDAQDLREIRLKVQRLFEGAKAKNVGAQADYVISLHNGQPGITPTIILYSEAPLETALDPQMSVGTVLIPYGVKLVAIDGETQLAARYEAANRMPETKDSAVAVYICKGLGNAWARQAFHDLNVLGVRPNAAVSIGMDARDPLTRLTSDLEARVPFFEGRISRTRRQLRASDPEVTTISALRGACVTFVHGIGGTKYGARPVPLPAGREAAVLEAAVEWWRGVTGLIGDALENRDDTVASAPAVLSALGAMGHPLLAADGPDQRRRGLNAQLAKLEAVDWARGRQWEGIAGKFTPKGAFTVGGSKETAHAIFGALNDETSAPYARIRSSTT
ncbi:DNA sulfur modification protein DndB [Acuticoccus sediminis]|nr:DNA sulfur modification protein DndB [Acuticoccus sediminis]